MRRCPLIDIEEIGSVRGVRLARVTFNPIHPENADTLRVITEIRVNIQFNSGDQGQISSKVEINPLTDALQQMVVNPQHLQAHTNSLPTESLLMTQQRGIGQAVVIEVEEAGITAVTRADLTNAGFSTSGIDPKKLQLRQNGLVIPIEWDGDGDAQFEADERIIFFADPEFSRWTHHDSYILTVESSNGARISSSASSTSGQSSWATVCDCAA